jgi:hypothetical protein
MADALWHTLRQQFETEGALIDLYVDESSVSGWQKAIDWIRSTTQFVYQEDGVTTDMPTSVADVFGRVDEASVSFGFAATDDVWVSAYFFSPEWFELTLDPAEIQTPEAFDVVIALMMKIGTLLEEPVLLTLESDPEQAFLAYDPADSSLTMPEPPTEEEKPTV